MNKYFPLRLEYYIIALMIGIVLGLILVVCEVV